MTPPDAPSRDAEVAALEASATRDTASDPSGYLACNHDEVAAFLSANGVDTDRFKQVPRPRHAWAGIMDCGVCGATFMLAPPA